MILLVGSNSNPSVLYYIDYLNLNNIKYLYLNQLYLDKCFFHSDYFEYESQKYYYREFTGVLNKFSEISNLVNCKEQINSKLIANQFLHMLLQYEFCKVLNRPIYSCSNESKLLQLSMVNTKHVQIPQNIILSNFNITDEAIKNLINPNNLFVVKSISGVRSIVRIFSEDEDCFEKRAIEPVLFQSFIKGYNVRVHVINNWCFAIKIESDSVDYRYNTIRETVFSTYVLPQNIAKACVKIATQLKLFFAGIDLICTEEGYFLLEVNPSPGWSYFEKKLGIYDITQKLTEYLTIPI